MHDRPASSARPSGWRRVAAVLVGALLVGVVVAPSGQAVERTGDGPTSLSWGECEGRQLRGTECARLDVPLDWADPDGRRISLALARIPSTGTASDRIGVLVFNPGGPGGSGVDELRFVARDLPRAVRERFDILTWDPRGVAASEPELVACGTAQPVVPPVTGPVDWASFATANVEATAARNADCLAVNGDVAPFLSTWYVIRDLDAIRAATGERQLTFWGMSYGTTVGRAYAQRFPGRVRAMVLDGAIDPLSTVPSYAREQFWASATGRARFNAWLSPRVETMQRRVMAALDGRVIAVDDGRTISRWDIIEYTLDYLPFQAWWPDIRDVIRTARTALFDEVPARRARAAERLANAMTPDDASPEDALKYDPLLPFVNCVDLTGRLGAGDVATIAQQAADVGGLAAGWLAVDEGATCAGISEDLGRPLRATPSIALRTPPVVVNSVADPRTPWLGARRAANVFDGAVMVTYDSAQHVTWMATQSRCVNEPVTDYVLTRRLPKRDSACPFARVPVG